MPSPSASWTVIPDTDIDGSSPITSTLATSITNNQQYLKERLYGTGSFVGSTPHVHTGTEDAKILAAHSHNLLRHSAHDEDGAGWGSTWPRSSSSDVDTLDDYGALWYASASGAYAYQILTTRADFKGMFGTNGGDFCVSVWIRAHQSAPSAGTWEFGLADGSTSAFLTTSKASIAASEIGTNWRRFYMFLSGKGGSAATDVRFLMKQGATPLNANVITTCHQVNLGKVLTYWSPCYLEDQSTHDDWKRYGILDCPAWSYQEAICDARNITGA